MIDNDSTRKLQMDPSEVTTQVTCGWYVIYWMRRKGDEDVLKQNKTETFFVLFAKCLQSFRVKGLIFNEFESDSLARGMQKN